MNTLSLFAATAKELHDHGARLGRGMGVGDVVGLTGGLGAGKTTFAQGIAEGLEVPRNRQVVSPTFALVNEHPGRVTFIHADLYRIKDPAELEELGLEEAFDRAAAALEWIDRYPDVAPPDHLTIHISIEPEGRRLLVSAGGPRGDRLLAALILDTAPCTPV